MASAITQADIEYKRRAELIKLEGVGKVPPSWHKLLKTRIAFLQEQMTNEPNMAIGCSTAIKEFRRLIADTTYSDPNE